MEVHQNPFFDVNVDLFNGNFLLLHFSSVFETKISFLIVPALIISTMNQSSLLTLSLVLVVTVSGALAAPANGDSKKHHLDTPEVFFHMNFSFPFATDSIKELYDYLLQREYAEPLSLDHQMERKAVRSPSMRLRFGRRSDPDIPLIGRVSRLIPLESSLQCLDFNHRIIKSIMKSTRSPSDHLL